MDTRNPNYIVPLNPMDMYVVVPPTRYEAALLMGQRETPRVWIEVPEWTE